MKVSKFELDLYNNLCKLCGLKNSVKIIKVMYRILYWFKYEPAILKLRIGTYIKLIQIAKLKLQCAIYNKILGETK